VAVLSHSEAEEYLSRLNKKVAKIAGELHKIFIDEGCSSYVKTIYVGYDFNGAMIAALYGHADYVEVALALPESFESPILIDGTHLTWQTLPVAAIVKNRDQILLFKSLAQTACSGVKTGTHTVKRDSEYFRKSKRERNENSSGTKKSPRDLKYGSKKPRSL